MKAKCGPVETKFYPLKLSDAFKIRLRHRIEVNEIFNLSILRSADTFVGFTKDPIKLDVRMIFLAFG